MKRIRKAKVSMICLLLVCFPVLLFSFSEPDQKIKELEEKLKTAADKEKIALYKNLSHMYETRGDFKKALEYHVRFSETKDSLYKKKNNQQVALMKAKYKTQKKENELHLLHKTRESQHKVRIFLVIAVLLSLGLVLVLFSQYRTKKQANQLLRSGEAKYRALFSQAGDAIFLIEDGSIVDCNEIALEMLGVTREEIIGQTFARFALPKQPDERDSFAVRMERINKALSGDPQRFYLQYFRKDGFPIETMVSLSAININNKRLIQVIIHDISDQRQLEEEQDEAPTLQPGHYVVISLKDNGEGIPKENLVKIFDPYFSTRGHITRKGLGMGLAIAQAIIKGHNGTITVSSRLGTGTTFHIYLPAGHRLNYQFKN